jgi:xylose isomerase
LNFDAKIRRQSIAPEDLIHAHVGGVDLCARAFLSAARMVEDGTLASCVADRYAGWETSEARAMLSGELSLEAIANSAEERGLNPIPRSGHQEQLENLVNRSII